MIQSLYALAIFVSLGAVVNALPGFAPKVKAGETIALAKADRLQIIPAKLSCARQVWPNFDGFCLRQGELGPAVREVSLVTARR